MGFPLFFIFFNSVNAQYKYYNRLFKIIMRELIETDMKPSDLSLDEIDEYANKHGFKSRSELTRYLLEKEILGVKTKIKDKLTYITILMLMAMISLMLLLLVR